MARSTTSTSISTFLMSHGTLLVLEPRRQTNADLKSANEVLVLIHEMVLAYCSPFLMAISCAQCPGLSLSRDAFFNDDYDDNNN